ncbi:MAG: PQQ-binding-like beta-propeller repeat protein [bacterium]|nr:PQQ-binding-like beta-propeller repeat protein [bacterium]
MTPNHREFLHKTITDRVFIPYEKEPNIKSEGSSEISRWLFDLKRVFLDPKVLNSTSALFWERYKTSCPLQIGGIEVASVPLMTALVLTGSELCPGVRGFIVRKSRKREGLMRMFEGELNEEKIILVDDVVNSGKSFIRQIEALETLGKKVYAVFAVIRYRDLGYYKYFHDKGIKVESLFTLDDFSSSLNVKNLVDKKERPAPMPFKAEWCFQSKNPAYFHVLPKSAPVVDDTRVYFGADNKVFWAINQNDGSIAWQHNILFSSRGKSIFSSPCLSEDTVFFGAYDGNFYALDKKTGRKKWIFMEADWIGSSPAIALDLGLVYIGLEFGLWKKQGSLAALDAKSGEKKWSYPMLLQTHASPGYSQKHSMVVCGSNDASAFGFDAKTGDLRWKFDTGGEIKAGVAFDDARGIVAFGSFDRYLYLLDTRTGKLIRRCETLESIYSTPLFYKNFIYVASLDKHLYCFDVETGAEVWKFATNGRIFASPKLIEGKIYIGSNDGRLYELDPETGKNTAFFQATERITNAVAYNPETKRVFLPTFANEIYSLSKNNT